MIEINTQTTTDRPVSDAAIVLQALHNLYANLDSWDTFILTWGKIPDDGPEDVTDHDSEVLEQRILELIEKIEGGMNK